MRLDKTVLIRSTLQLFDAILFPGFFFLMFVSNNSELELLYLYIVFFIDFELVKFKAQGNSITVKYPYSPYSHLWEDVK